MDWMFNNYCSIDPDTSSDRFDLPNSMKLALILTHLSTEAFSDTSFGGISSVGRALAWHARGQEFDSPMLHHSR